MLIQCIICSSSNIHFLYSLVDDRYGYPGHFRLFECKACRHKYLEAEFTQEEITSLYTNYYPRALINIDFTYRQPRSVNDWLNGAYSAAFRWVPENVKVLDIGCGMGESLYYFQSRGCDAYGVEADKNIGRAVQKYNFKVQIGLFNPDNFQKEFFDYVTINQVIEHVANPTKVMREAASLLRHAGCLIISSPNAMGLGAKVFGRRWINWHAPYHRQHFSEKSMMLAAAQTGFSLERTFTVTSSEWLLYQWIHLLLYPASGEPSAFWSPHVKRGLREKGTIKLLNILHKSKINHLLTRLMDALSLGDNRLYFLRKSG